MTFLQTKWNNYEVEILKEKYPTYGPKNLAPVLNRGWVSVYNKARKLGIKTLKGHTDTVTSVSFSYDGKK